jgi:hypothetical protein
MANVKERYTQVTREARTGRFEKASKAGVGSPTLRDKELAEEQRLAARFRKRARDDYEAASTKG